MPSPAPRKRPRRLWLKLTVSIVLTLVLLEGVLRLLPCPIEPLARLESLRGFYRPAADGSLETAPGFRGSIAVDGRTTAANLNALGLRGPEIPAKAAGERRVLMLGDSFVFGLGVDADEAIPAALERRLAASAATPAPGAPAVRVGNAGMWGTGPREWTHTLQRHRQAFAPDAVVAVLYAGNDPLDTLSAPMSVADGWLLPSIYTRLYRESLRMRLMMHLRSWMYLEWFALLRLWPMGGASPEEWPLPKGLSGHEAYFLDVGLDQAAPWLGAVEPKLAAPLRDFAAAAPGLPRLVVVLPAREACSPAMWQRGLHRELERAGLAEHAAKFARGAAGRRLARLCEQAGLPVVDLTDRFFALPDPDAVFLSDYHLDATGCALVAEWLEPHVRELLR